MKADTDGNDAIEKAEAQVTAAQNALTGAKNAKATADEQVATAKQKLEAAKSAQQTAEQTVTAKQQSVTTAKQNVTAAQQSVDNAMQAAQTAKQQAEAAGTAYSNAKAAEQTAKQKLDEANATLATAKKATSDATAKVTEAQKAYDEAEAKVADLKAQYNEGVYGFFKSMGAQSAIDVLDNAKYASYTHKGEETDATSLQNMKETVQWMKKLNELRAENGLNALDVSLELIAASISNVNWSSDGLHKNMILQHSRQFNVGENLATGIEDCFDGWYYEEKDNVAEFKAQLGISNVKDTDLTEDQRDQISALATAEKQVGHYFNIIDADYGIMGYAINSYGWTLSGTTFYFAGIHPSNGIDWNQHTMTVSEFETTLNSYIDSVDYQKVIAAA